MLDHLFEIGRDQNHPHALIAEAPDRLKDFLLGAEVDAPGRFVEQQDLGFPVEPFSKHELLLISSRQIERLGIEPLGIESKLPGKHLAPLARLAPVDDGPGGNSVKIGQHQVGQRRACQHQSLALAVLRGEHDAAPDRLANGSWPGAIHACKAHRSFRRGLGPGDTAQHFAASGSDQAGDSKNLAFMKAE